jgi:molybdopterin molybdotransferase
MLAVAEAQRRIWAALGPGPIEWIDLDAALGRVLARDLVAMRDQPPAAVSAMDGYAVRAADTTDPGRVLRILGEIPAGRLPAMAVSAGEAVRIFTGGLLPDGADAILIQENAEPVAGGVRPLVAVAPGSFVRPRALDFAAGWIGLAAGRRLDPLALGLAAALGHAKLPVHRRPRVGLLATGDELRRPGAPLGPADVVASSLPMLGGLVRQWGGEPVDLGIATDDPDALATALDQAVGLDLLVTSGGASVGAYDLVRGALDRRGLELDFWTVAMRPGKPLVFGRLGGTPVLGLPGNPVSAAVCAIVFLRGLLRRALALDPRLPIRPLPVAGGLPANDQREDYVRARLEPGPSGELRARPAPRQDSSMLATMAHAGALIVRPPHAPPLEDGAAAPALRLADVTDGLA